MKEVTTLDYIWLILFAAGLIFGLVKGFMKMAFAAIGVVVVFVATSYLSPYVDGWLVSAIENGGTRAIVAMIVTFVVLSIVYGLITKLINKLINKVPVLGWINRALGAVVGAGIVYLVFSLLTSLVFNSYEGTLTNLVSSLKPAFEESWVITNIYGGAENPEVNFFGNWLIENFIEKISQYLPETPLE